MTQYTLCSAVRFESSKPGRTGWDKGCHVDLGIFRDALLCFRPLWAQSIKEKYVSGLDYLHNPSDHPAARHPAQPSLNRRQSWVVADRVWAKGAGEEKGKWRWSKTGSGVDKRADGGAEVWTHQGRRQKSINKRRQKRLNHFQKVANGLERPCDVTKIYHLDMSTCHSLNCGTSTFRSI